jgi:hypothetical protein
MTEEIRIPKMSSSAGIRYQDEEEVGGYEEENHENRQEETIRGRGGRGDGDRIIQPFSPPTKFGNARKLERCLERLGVSEKLREACSDFSVPIFLYLSKEDLNELGGSTRMGGSILKSTQESIKAETAQMDETANHKRRREEWDIDSEGIEGRREDRDERRDSGGLDCLVRH